MVFNNKNYDRFGSIAATVPGQPNNRRDKILECLKVYSYIDQQYIVGNYFMIFSISKDINKKNIIFDTQDRLDVLLCKSICKHI